MEAVTEQLSDLSLPPTPPRVLSVRGQGYRVDSTLMITGKRHCDTDPYSPQNANGYINLGTSELRVCYELLTDRLRAIAHHTVPNHLTHYLTDHGDLPLRQAVADMLNKFSQYVKPIDPNGIIVSNGCGTTCELLSFCLMDPGEGIMIPTPYYGGYDPDFTKRPGAVVVPVVRTSENGFVLTRESLDQAWAQSQQSGIRVRALLVTNPDNPTGNLLSRETLRSCVDFVRKHKIHLIVNEMYFMSIHDAASRDKHVSILSFPEEELPDKEFLHFIWGFSKTFAMSGFRIGCLYSRSESLLDSMQQIAYFAQAGGFTQHHMRLMISDLDWVASYTAQARDLLAESYAFVTAALDKLGVKYIQSKGGFFIWVDFSKFLKERTFEAESSLWKAFLSHRVNIALGGTFHCCEPGWFRIIFSHPVSVLQVALPRIEKACLEFFASS
eukprot:m.191848 g.191848  ORF g.191848 m.191848 type:complete len:440 (+) comp53642_c0_seq2:343-1662(+)